jgi:hypothetical protein
MGQLFNRTEDMVKRGLTYDLWKGFPAYEILVEKDANVGVGVMLDPVAPPYAAASSTKTVAGNGVLAFTDATTSIGGLTHAQYSGGQGLRLMASADNVAAELQWCNGGETVLH